MKKTVVHCYSLAADYQTVINISEMDTVDHIVTSLHNIEGTIFLFFFHNSQKIGTKLQNFRLFCLYFIY